MDSNYYCSTLIVITHSYDKLNLNFDIMLIVVGEKNRNMPTLSKTLTLRIPSNIVYRALKDTRLENLFPEFFLGIERKVITDKINKEISFNTITQGKQIEIIETFKFKISNNNRTIIEYITETKSIEENNIVLESIVQTHVANILYSLLMLETGYINGVLEKKERKK